MVTLSLQAVHRPGGGGHPRHVQGSHAEPPAHPRQVTLPLQPARLLPRHPRRAAVHPGDHGRACRHEAALGARGGYSLLTGLNLRVHEVGTAFSQASTLGCTRWVQPSTGLNLWVHEVGTAFYRPQPLGARGGYSLLQA